MIKLISIKELYRRLKRGIGLFLISFGGALIGGLISVNKPQNSLTIIIFLIFIILILSLGALLSEDKSRNNKNDSNKT